MADERRVHLEEIGDFAGSLRPFLENKWREWKAAGPRSFDAFETLSAGMCGFTSAFLAAALEEEFGGSWRIAGGAPIAGGGVTCGHGRQNGHFWAVSDEGTVVDLTADQFGMPCVLVTTSADLRYVETFSPAEIECHLPRVLALALDWLEQAKDEGILRPRHALAA